MSCSTCKKGCSKSKSQCPLCGRNTHKVLTNEVYGMIKNSVKPYVYATHFHLCDNEDCEVVFHSADLEEIILTQDINKLQIQSEENNDSKENTKNG